MPLGRLVDGGPSRPYEPPRSQGGGDGLSAEARIEEAIRSGYAEGVARGRAEAQAAAQQQRAAVQQQLAQALGAVQQLEQQLLERCRGRLLEMALGVAERIVRGRIESGDPVAVRAAEELLGAAPRHVTRKIRVNPADYDAILQAAPALAEPGTLTIVSDPRVGAGGLMIESADEVVDARVETALGAVAEVFEEER